MSDLSQPSESSEDFRSTASVESLRRRAALLARIRKFFDSQDFFEVETPLVSADVVVDRHIEPIMIPGDSVGVGSHTRFWLQTSPEFAMKRLLASGAQRIYQIGKAFRKSERGDHHNTEFTMLEWYRTGDNYVAGRQLLADFAKAILDCSAVEQTSYRNAFVEHVGVCPFTGELAELVQAVNQRTRAALPEDTTDRDEVLNILLSEIVEPKLGQDQPTILFDFPASQAALAKVRPADPPVAERFELYFRGTELGNGYHELLDPDELVARNTLANQQRLTDAKQDLPVQSRLVDAMRAGLPACCGCAIGVDRLAMQLENANRIDEVIAFPIERA